jgi:prolyl-tRNA synthetase
MRQSQLFTKTRKEAPKDEVAKNAELLIRAGYIHKEMAGVYAFLPLGLRVMNNIEGIIREEMNAIGGQELSMTALQNKDVWEKTGRWSDVVVDNWFKTKLKNEAEVGLAFTHEEPLTAIMAEYISSYRDLPQYAYQFQTKFRNESRAKSGIMRGREFLMKDLYSFSADAASHEAFYEKVSQAYTAIFKRVGIGHITYKTFASGGTFSKFSHEFQTVTEAGEDILYVAENKGIAINKEVYNDDTKKYLGVDADDFVEMKAVEVGNIFTLGTKFSEPLGLKYLNEKGEAQPVFMGSYGIGVSRLMGTIVEVLSDEKGIVWPASVAPFAVHLVLLAGKDGNAAEAAGALYNKLGSVGIEVLFDDRDLRPGEKFADSDLIGIPVRVVVSDKTLAGGALEVKDRKTGDVSMMAEADLLKKLSTEKADE